MICEGTSILLDWWIFRKESLGIGENACSKVVWQGHLHVIIRLDFLEQISICKESNGPHIYLKIYERKVFGWKQKMHAFSLCSQLHITDPTSQFKIFAFIRRVPIVGAFCCLHLFILFYFSQSSHYFQINVQIQLRCSIISQF